MADIVEQAREVANGRYDLLKTDSGDYGLCDDLADTITALQARIARLEEALEEIERHHGNNPSDAMADMPEVDYLRYTLMSARRVARDALSDNPDSWSRHCPNCEALAKRVGRLEAALRSAIGNCNRCGGTGVRNLYSVDPENGTSREIGVKCLECSDPRAALNETPDTPQDTRICKICDGGPGNNGVCTCGMKAWDTEDKGDGK